MSSKPEFGCIFDFDGVLADTMPTHFASYKDALEEAGVPIDKDQFYYQAGMTGREQILSFCDKAGVKANVDKIYARKNELTHKYMDLIKPINSNIKLLNVLKKAGIPIAIASGSSYSSIIMVMKKYGIEVDKIVCSEDVDRGKPHPDLFLSAAKKLGLIPSECFVIEDSDVGMQAARSAGMRAFRFVNIE